MRSRWLDEEADAAVTRVSGAVLAVHTAGRRDRDLPAIGADGDAELLAVDEVLSGCGEHRTFPASWVRVSSTGHVAA